MKDSALINRLRRLEEPAEPAGIADELGLIKSGQTPHVAPEDDHGYHLLRHNNELRSLVPRVLRGMESSETLRVLEGHIAEHELARRGG